MFKLLKKEILDSNYIIENMAIKCFFTTSNDFVSRILRSMTNVPCFKRYHQENPTGEIFANHII